MATEYVKGIGGKPLLAERAKNTYGGLNIDETLIEMSDAIGTLDGQVVRMTDEDLGVIQAVFA